MHTRGKGIKKSKKFVDVISASSPTLHQSSHRGRNEKKSLSFQSQLCGLATWHGRCSRLSSDSEPSSDDDDGGGNIFAAADTEFAEDDRRAANVAVAEAALASSEDALVDAVATMLIN